MPLLIVALGVVLLLVMMTRFKLNGFVSLILVALLVGLLQGLGLSKTYDSIVDGIGGQLDDLVMILGFGAMLGKILADSGAAQQIASRMVTVFGVSRVQLAMILTSFAIGITMFYEVGFVLLIPIVFTIVREQKLPLLWVGLPMSISLSTMHSFLPPHPGPSAVAGTFDASLGLTLFYGLFIAIPAAALIAFLWPRLPFIRAMNPQLPVSLITTEEFPEEDLPGFATSLAVVLIPVVLMAISAVGTLFLDDKNPVLPYVTFFGEGPVALLIALLAGIYVLGPAINLAAARRAPAQPLAVGAATSGAGGTSLPARPAPPSRWSGVSTSCSEAVKPIAMIILVIGGGGAFKQVLIDAGVADYIKDFTSGWDISPLLLAWAIAVVLRISLGSATVAVVTASGIVLPLVHGSGTSPELMVLAVSCGSIAFSHVNDPGFWLFKEYFNLSVVDAIKSRTSYTTVLSLIGITGVMLESTIIH